jgi:predicted amidohydrolase
MKRLSFVLLAAAIPGLALAQTRFVGFKSSAGWTAWAPRAEIAPKTYVDSKRSKSTKGSLAISAPGASPVTGGWERTIPGVEAGKWYRLTAWYQAEGLRHEDSQILSRLDWQTTKGQRAGQPEYAWRVTGQGTWKQITVEAPAPSGASAVKLQFFLLNTARGKVWWDEIQFEPIATPAARPVLIAAINERPAKSASAAASVEKFVQTVDSKVQGKTDIIVLSEGITVVGTGKSYAQVAEPVPGPTTERLGALARRKNAYIVAGIYEREGLLIYNTAVLIDRSGKYAGKYRKVYLPREEMEGGLTAGSGFPVFQTDFGKIGIMICWDVQYTDPARALALGGAELIVLPIWGGNTVLGRARAIENHVFLAASGYDYPTYIMDPDGEILAEARERGTAARATIDLNRRYSDKWLGEMRGRLFREVRGDLDLNPPERK